MLLGLITFESPHFLLSLGIGLLLFTRYQNRRLILASFLFGFFIDVDHLFDFFAYFGLHFNLLDFFNVNTYIVPAGKSYVPLHGWEFVPLFWLVAKKLGEKWKIKGLEWAVSLSYFGHLLIDHFSFLHRSWAYSFFFRWLNGFSLEVFDQF